jgi:transposase
VLKNRNANRVHACLEATGGWSEQVAISLGEAGHVVSIVNPARIKAFAQSEMVRTKTDRIDAALIARFAGSINQSLGSLLRRKYAFYKALFAANTALSRCELRKKTGAPLRWWRLR